MGETNRKRTVSRIAAALIAALLVIVLAFCAFEQSVSAYEATPQSDAVPNVRAKSAIVYSEDLDKIIYSKNPDARLNPYSITKLMTAYVVLQNLELDHRVKIRGINADYMESQMFLKDGEVLTVEQLLEGLIIESGNDAARALAKEVAGSEKKFAEMMTAQAREWGCKKTNFANASGMQDPKHYTCASDYLIIAHKVFENDTLRRICTTKKVSIPATSESKKRIYRNHTTLINDKSSGVIGGKTGFWSEKDCSVVLQYFKKDMRLTLVILGDTEKGREKDVAVLTKAAHEMVPGYIVAKPKERTCRLWIKGGEFTLIPAYVKERAYAYPAEGEEASIRIKTAAKEGLKAPLKKGQVIGSCEVYVDGELRATHDLVTHKAVKAGWFTSNLYISNRAAVAIPVAAVILITAVLIFLKKRKKPDNENEPAPETENETETATENEAETETETQANLKL